VVDIKDVSKDPQYYYVSNPPYATKAIMEKQKKDRQLYELSCKAKKNHVNEADRLKYREDCVFCYLDITN